ncbi:MAG TPA: 2-oxoglutarate dehydrogenase complex dihydrolipoyllysine-residue succinyltransferase [Candidatus Competibacteraceae bacterium]|nr:MAG: 2-oxoglutarate dehydrogenase complex dihydrolipoyllysine-residue succinyltransferase [Candidatus Competibacteraceae bacterium]HOB60579.1 2-oxoglutarate dehydrogenase complex dihydrolipoyllysine-residue succinyltransferase [Candidatus Competibacteraceae bacterium]HQA24701.1 2-oxoglutarate dehydrogenase complex dihydrolipoyllysine-residue succinyltransferase [Candidatus Competibacteraceae bacterium]HQD54950.1 2-oxoglutarate dehydrogenase complex dihydrolipoyllysine-residue succinyltransfer
MTTEVKVPTLPESVSDGTLVNWKKKPGEPVKRGENLVDLETDKVVLDIPAPADGVMGPILRQEGDVVTTGDVIATLEEGAVAAASAPAAAPAPVAAPAPAPVAAVAAAPAGKVDLEGLSPAVRRLAAEHGLDISKVIASGRGGRVTKADVLAYLDGRSTAAAPAASAPVSLAPAVAAPAPAPVAPDTRGRVEQRVPMTRLRARIAERLLMAKNTTAMLTTFNEINMKPVMELRARYKDSFEKKHGVRLGFMGFFVKAVVEALKRFPAVNGSIDGNDIVYHGYYDIGVAVSSPRGLVVPILRDADQMSLADIEKAIGEFGKKAKEGTLTVEEMTGGTFTITNGGVFGSLMSTPILNPPQSGILGMHATKDRAVVENGQVVARPMMYVAHSYDHRIIDGREAVTFLVTVKECIEDPARILLNV